MATLAQPEPRRTPPWWRNPEWLILLLTLIGAIIGAIRTDATREAELVALTATVQANAATETQHHEETLQRINDLDNHLSTFMTRVAVGGSGDKGGKQ